MNIFNASGNTKIVIEFIIYAGVHLVILANISTDREAFPGLQTTRASQFESISTRKLSSSRQS